MGRTEEAGDAAVRVMTTLFRQVHKRVGLHWSEETDALVADMVADLIRASADQAHEDMRR